MGKFSMTIDHFKKNQLYALDRHERRLNENYGNDEIDSTRTHLNKILVGGVNTLEEDVTRLIDKNVDKTKSRITKNSIYVTSFVFTLPDSVPIEHSKKYFCDCISALSSISKEGNIVQAVIHYDETTPHMHLSFVPITLDNCLSRKRLFTKKSLKSLHKKMYQIMKDKGWDIEQPEDSKNKNYVSLKELKKNKSELQKEVQQLENYKEDLLSGNMEIARAYMHYINQQMR